MNDTLALRRQAEIDRYGPDYYGIMRLWRQDIVREWLEQHGKRGMTYLDVGTGKGEAMSIAGSLNLTMRGCEVVPHLCGRAEIDQIPGIHDLSIYEASAFDLLTCNDVLEHVLEEDIPAGLSEMSRVTKDRLLLGICRKSGPWHPTIRSEEWWLEMIPEWMSGSWKVVYADRVPKVKKPYLWVDVKCYGG